MFDRKTKGSVTPEDKVIGANLKMLRFKSGAPQQKIAEKLGVTFQQIQKYEKGINRISAFNLYRLSKFFGVDMCAFFNGIEENGKPAETITKTDKAVLDMARSFKAIENPEVQKLITIMIQEAHKNNKIT